MQEKIPLQRGQLVWSAICTHKCWVLQNSLFRSSRKNNCTGMKQADNLRLLKQREWMKHVTCVLCPRTLLTVKYKPLWLVKACRMHYRGMWTETTFDLWNPTQFYYMSCNTHVILMIVSLTTIYGGINWSLMLPTHEKRTWTTICGEMGLGMKYSNNRPVSLTQY